MLLIFLFQQALWHATLQRIKIAESHLPVERLDLSEPAEGASGVGSAQHEPATATAAPRAAIATAADPGAAATATAATSTVDLAASASGLDEPGTELCR